MLIKLTRSETKREFILPHNTVLTVERVAGSLLETLVVTGLAFGGKQVAINVLESPEEVMNIVNAAIVEELKAQRAAGLH